MKTSDLYRLSDSDLITALQAYNTQLTAAPVAYGMDSGDAGNMTTSLLQLNAAVTDLAAKRTAVDGAVEARDAARKAAIDLAREQFKTARAKSGMTSEMLALANLDAYETPSKAPAPESVPIAMIDYAKLRHTIRFRDAASPDSSKKPAGVMGCEIWVKLDGTPPADEKECQFLALDTATPYVANYPGTDGGKIAHYLLRWVNKHGEKSPWSEVVTATINA